MSSYHNGLISSRILDIMEINSIKDIINCYGCGVCTSACPKSIISLKINKQGFFQPIVSGEDCVSCGRCVQVCSFIDNHVKTDVIASYAAWSNDEEIRSMSSSGGIAYEISSFLLNSGYHVIAVRYNFEKEIAEHFIIKDIDDLKSSRGSKYVQSYLPNVLNEINKDQKYVVFSTPCQIHSLKKLFELKKFNKESLFIDFFCHGTPSYNMLNKYIEMYSQDTGKIKELVWRDKSNGGWHNSWNMILKGEKGTHSLSLAENDIFYKFFLRNRCLNYSCYHSCKYKLSASLADIRLGDLWGEKYKNDNKGISGVLVNSKRGELLIKKMTSCTFINEPISVVTEAQMKRCAKKPASYKLVNHYLQTSKNLLFIDKLASSTEFIFDYIPKLFKRAFRKLLRIIK